MRPIRMAWCICVERKDRCLRVDPRDERLLLVLSRWSPMAKCILGTRKGNFCVLAAGREKKVLCNLELKSPISATDDRGKRRRLCDDDEAALGACEVTITLLAFMIRRNDGR